MFKKVAALLLSLLLCSSFFPWQVHSADVPDLPEPSAQVEPTESENPVAPASVEGFPKDEDDGHTKN